MVKLVSLYFVSLQVIEPIGSVKRGLTIYALDNFLSSEIPEGHWIWPVSVTLVL